MDNKTKKRITKKEPTLSWLLLFLLQCTVSNYCLYKLSLAIPYIDLSDFFIQADRLGISSRVSVYITKGGNAALVSHHTIGVYICRLDDIQPLRG